jgi:hypothetical protein
MNRELLAWAAGFFDGEGCIHLRKHGGIPMISFSQKDPGVLRKFARIVRIGTVSPYTKIVTGRNFHREYWRYGVSGIEAVQYIVGCLWPWLSKVKRDQAIRVLVGYKTYPSTRNYRRIIPSLDIRRHPDKLDKTVTLPR